MKPRKRETRYVSILTVHVPSAAALIDMMRYDRCCPATEQDSSKIERMIGNRTEPKDHIIRLTRYAGADQGATLGRWQSFGCTVLEERNPEDYSELTDEQALNLAKVKGLRF